MPSHRLLPLALLLIPLLPSPAVARAQTMTLDPTVAAPTPTAEPGPTIVITGTSLQRRSGGKLIPTHTLRIGQTGRWTVRYRVANGGGRRPLSNLILQAGGKVLFTGEMTAAGGSFYQEGRFKAVIGPASATYTLKLDGAIATRTVRFTLKLPKF